MERFPLTVTVSTAYIECVMAYRTINGRRQQLPRPSTNGIQHLVSLVGPVATFECKDAGHRMTHDFSKGPVSKRIPESSLKMLAPSWAKGRGHCYGWCQKCQNVADGLEAR